MSNIFDCHLIILQMKISTLFVWYDVQNKQSGKHVKLKNHNQIYFQV